jgi:hypothetical protein
MSEYHVLEFVLLTSIIVSNGSGKTDFIISSSKISDVCLSEQCLTLSQFVANSTYIGRDTTLTLLDGDHFLKSDLIITNTTDFFIVSSDNPTSIICEPSTELSFTSIAFAHIKDIRFLNYIFGVFHVDQFTIEDCSFELHSASKLLQLARVNTFIQSSSLVN